MKTQRQLLLAVLITSASLLAAGAFVGCEKGEEKDDRGSEDGRGEGRGRRREDRGRRE